MEWSGPFALSRIYEAIANRLVIKVTLAGESGPRVIEPHMLGRHQRSQELTLVAWQRSGPSASGSPVGWKRISLDRIDGEVVAVGEFPQARQGFNPSDPIIAEVLASLPES